MHAKRDVAERERERVLPKTRNYFYCKFHISNKIFFESHIEEENKNEELFS